MSNITFTMIKPDAVEKNFIGPILDKINNAGFRIKAMKYMRLTEAEAKAFYAVHKERPFYNDLVNFMTSGPVMVQVLEGENAIALNRQVMGATNPADADEGTIRKDFATNVEENAVHGSDAPETAATEISFFFSDDEICTRTR